MTGPPPCSHFSLTRLVDSSSKMYLHIVTSQLIKPEYAERVMGAIFKAIEDGSEDVRMLMKAALYLSQM